MTQDFTPLFGRIGFQVEDQVLLKEAFTHRSVLNESSKDVVHNERLEFLGDAVLELVTTEFLFCTFEDPEGVLTNYRSALVKGEHLAQVSRKLCLGDYLLLSKGEARSGGAEKDYLLANLVEAFIGAIYLDKGMEAASGFIHEFVLCDLDEIMENRTHIDSKSEFQELAQARVGITPWYDVLEESGLDHEKWFKMAAFLDEKQVGEGEGRSKKEAQLSAAADALDKQKEWLPK